MNNTRYNPFKPNSPVYTSVFAGRYNELSQIEDILLQTKKGNPSNAMIVGERGIGKTSLLLYAKFLAKGDISYNHEQHNFLTVQFNISSDMTPLDFAIKIKNCISRELTKDKKLLEYIKKTWSFLQRIEAFGVSIKKQEQETHLNIYDELVYSLVDTIKSITNSDAFTDTGLIEKKDGLVLFIDEADNASQKLNLGAFLKNLSESLLIENCNRMSVFLAGLPRLHDVLLESHESSLRLFREIELPPLTMDNVRYVINKGIEESNGHIDANEEPTNINEDALDLIWAYSEGYPHFVQQTAYSTFAINSDNTITSEDVKAGMFSKGGALELIGARYYKDLYYEKISVDSYRQILNIMARKWNDWISKKEIEENFKGKKTSLDNGIKALRDRNIILSKKSSPGFYRLQWLSFAFWIKNYTEHKINMDNLLLL